MDKINSVKKISNRRKSLAGNTRPNCKRTMSIIHHTVATVSHAHPYNTVTHAHTHTYMHTHKLYIIINTHNTLSSTAMMMTEINKKMNCLRYQVDHSTHWLRPIMSIDSRIRVSFSRTSSYRGCIWN